MANEVLIPEAPTPTHIVWSDTTDFSVTGVTRTHQVDLTSLAAAGYREGAKADLGANRAELYVMELRVEFDVAPTSGELFQVFLSWSRSATVGSLNPGEAAGADQAYAGTTGDSAADSVRQMDGPYIMVCTSDVAPVAIIQTIGIVTAQQRYVSPVFFNDADQALEGDAVEMYLALRPLVAEVQ